MTPTFSTCRIDGFEVLSLGHAGLAVSVVPQLGGRVVSIHDRISGREWLDGWQPASSRRLWEPSDPLCYESGPGAGIDECLPTVLPCDVAGSPLPDHGELWCRGAPIEVGPGPAFHNRWSLHSLPIEFERRIELADRQLRFDYRIRATGDRPTPFQWAWHPLFTLEPGDRLVLPDPVDSCTDPGGALMPWPRSAPDRDLSIAEPGGTGPRCAKVFVGPLGTAPIEIRSARGNLHLEWDTKWLPWAGIWINRGAWKGLHHWAIEPTNLAADRLSDAASNDPLTTLQPGEHRSWSVRLKVSSP